MKHFIVLVLVAEFLCGGALLAATIEATTSDGRKVLLRDDGTWAFKEQEVSAGSAHEFRKPDSATEVLKSKKGFFELWYDPNKWTTRSGINHDAAEFTLAHSSGDAYAMAIVERIGMPLASLRKIAIDNAKATAPDARITLEEERTVNGKKVMTLQIEGIIQGIPFKYYGYYWTGDAGTLQLLTYTSQNLFAEVADDFTELLNGAVITKN